MEAFLSVAKGSDQLPVFLEIKYNGVKDGSRPVVLVGKGVTFDRYIRVSLPTDKMHIFIIQLQYL